MGYQSHHLLSGQILIMEGENIVELLKLGHVELHGSYSPSLRWKKLPRKKRNLQELGKTRICPIKPAVVPHSWRVQDRLKQLSTDSSTKVELKMIMTDQQDQPIGQLQTATATVSRIWCYQCKTWIRLEDLAAGQPVSTSLWPSQFSPGNSVLQWSRSWPWELGVADNQERFTEGMGLAGHYRRTSGTFTWVDWFCGSWLESWLWINVHRFWMFLVVF
jgi:hypothetical protein